MNDSIKVPQVSSFADRSPMSTLQALKPLIVRASLFPFILFAIGLSAGAALAQQPSTVGANLFAPSPQLGKTIDAERELPITSFYSQIELKADGKPGTLVRSEPATGYDLPPGITATRILYYTRAASGNAALASGVVLVPYGRPPKGGWPLPHFHLVDKIYPATDAQWNTFSAGVLAKVGANLQSAKGKVSFDQIVQITEQF